MALAFRTAVTAKVENVAQQSCSVSVATQSGDSMLVACVNVQGGAGDDIAISFNGDDFIQAVDQDTGRAAIWYLPCPSITTANVTMTWTGGGNQRAYLHVLVLTGNDTVDPVGVTAGNTEHTANSDSETVTTEAANSLIVSALFGGGAADNVDVTGTNQTLRTEVTQSGDSIFATSTTAAGAAGSHTVSWSCTSTDPLISVCAEFKAGTPGCVEASAFVPKVIMF